MLISQIPSSACALLEVVPSQLTTASQAWSNSSPGTVSTSISRPRRAMAIQCGTGSLSAGCSFPADLNGHRFALSFGTGIKQRLRLSDLVQHPEVPAERWVDDWVSRGRSEGTSCLAEVYCEL